MNPKKGDLYKTPVDSTRLDNQFVTYLKKEDNSYVIVEYIHPFLRREQLRGDVAGRWAPEILIKCPD
jgi:hypothetical protein